MSLGIPIAIGRTAAIYSWGEDRVLKLFHEWFPQEGISHEARIARTVHAAGLPVPEVGGILEVDGRLGLEYERVRGVSMRAEMATRPWRMIGSACRLADLHARIHGVPGPAGIPSQQERLKAQVDQAKGLSGDLRQAALRALERMPKGDRLCHGDFHPGNVILTERGPIVLDWIDATVGNPIADVARTSVLVEGECVVGTSLSRFQKTMVRLSHRAYLHRYMRSRPGKEDDHMRWRPIIVAARMSEGIEERQDWLRTFAEAGLGKVQVL